MPNVSSPCCITTAYTTITIRFSGTNFVSPLFPSHEPQRPPIIIVFSPQCRQYTLQPSNRYYCAHHWGSSEVLYSTRTCVSTSWGRLYRCIQRVYTACALEHVCSCFTIQRFDDDDDDDDDINNTKRLHRTTLKLSGRYSFRQKGWILYKRYEAYHRRQCDIRVTIIYIIYQL